MDVSVLYELVYLVECLPHWLVAIGFAILEQPDARPAATQRLLDELVHVEVNDAESDLVLALVEVVVQDADRSHREAVDVVAVVRTVGDRCSHGNHPDRIPCQPLSSLIVDDVLVIVVIVNVLDMIGGATTVRKAEQWVSMACLLFRPEYLVGIHVHVLSVVLDSFKLVAFGWHVLRCLLGLDLLWLSLWLHLGNLDVDVSAQD